MDTPETCFFLQRIRTLLRRNVDELDAAQSALALELRRRAPSTRVLRDHSCPVPLVSQTRFAASGSQFLHISMQLTEAQRELMGLDADHDSTHQSNFSEVQRILHIMQDSQNLHVRIHDHVLLFMFMFM